ncbi:MAG TPA: glutathione peroxidase [Oligoflexus sp.]|uniref:glutathione peroxidase n=1 Tax=Oligoflexus sp. TaxID=1971216 RepID=UPI002D7F30EE|nr:glutathione peroxidase [Oligoflexus sp.]HET9237761.1 glutathione peroxidase [Oligoflexus sp.]
MGIYDFKAKTIDGHEQSLADFRGQTLLIVNTASGCGFTPQYKGLEQLYETYKDRKFTVLGFPCNQFGKQESGSEADIKSFCEMNFGVKFPLFAKIDVKGPKAHPLYQYLVKEKPGFIFKDIKWNFTKFLVDKDGRVVKRYAPTVKPEAITADIEKLLKG